eukprot:gnl/TRDRNA2_/TRDRNA2_211747_c0_seq1.p1 gnl/TRDRNA2_/TRDRNA2_211747_c0~~gnl/TRDRNA2_/TRDRNA2_211747_c0_seq1.p1  ORF type:complete len:225 (+),score=9.16 gnl/TRDRNA2_/TRDRNA2_211747_c0_seq1:2-676(+)
MKSLLSRGETTEEFACNWLKTNENVWKMWIPVRTKCSAGQGLVDSLGQYLTSILGAVDCKWCQPGSRSVPLDGTSTMVCIPCDMGAFSQDPGQAECASCPAGTFSNKHGQRECQGCAVGTYQPLTGKTACEECPTPMTTMLLKASSTSQCVCPQDMYKPLGIDANFTPTSTSTARCLVCPEGLMCDAGSDAANIPKRPSEASLQGDARLLVHERLAKTYIYIYM